MIDDHNVPTLQQMADFARSAREWLRADAENVAVVHCKGGKGRTGTMICLWLVESGVFSTADGSLEYFGQRRTDTNVGSKFQGVETPSQARYVGYFERMKRELDGKPPPPRWLALRGVEVRGVMYVGRGDGSDLWFEVRRRGERVFSAHLGRSRNCQADYNPEQDHLQVKVHNCPPLAGDVRVLFQTTSPGVPRGYENAPWYFWFNSSFLSADEESGRPCLRLAREQVDNPHKAKTWHCFRPNFHVTCWFEDVAAPSAIGKANGDAVV